MTTSAVSTILRSFTASDGIELSYAEWSREAVSDSPTIVLVLHGIGYHSEPYFIVPENLDMPNTLFVGLDLRGHGRSQGARGTLASPRRIVHDIGEWIGHLESQYPDSRKVLIGESMTGPYATLFAAQNPRLLSGLLLIAPAGLVSWRQVLHLDTLKAVIKSIRSPSSPAFDLASWRLAIGTDNPEFIAGRRADPLAINRVSSKYVLRIAQAITQVFARKTLTVNCPTLILQGGKDYVISPFGSRLLLFRLNSPQKELVVFPKARHTLLWDISSGSQVFSQIENWLSSL